MNTPNPLIPQGSLQQQQHRGKSTVRIAVFTIVAIHAVFFTGLLIQGCRPDADKTSGKISGNSAASNEVAKLPTNTEYYSNVRELSSIVATNNAASNEIPPVVTQQQQPAPLSNSIQQIPEAPAQTKEYTIARGDTLGKVAKANGITLAALTKANPGVEPTKLQLGQKIQIPAPVAAAAGSTSAKGPGFVEPAASESGTNVHVVKAGETLNKIAHQHGTTVKALKAANNLTTDRLMVGKKLKIPAGQPSGKTGGSNSITAGLSGGVTSTNAMSAAPLGSTALNPR